MSAEPAPPRLSFPRTLIPARARLRSPVDLPEYLPARMLNEFVYCPRLFYYEWVDGVFRHNTDTEDGAFRHEKHDSKEDALPEPEAIEPDDDLKARSVTLSSDAHGLIAKLDLVEAAHGRVTPVDYKRGRPRDGESGPEAWPADSAQIAVQALVLRDNGYTCDEGLVFYYETRQRVRIAITGELVSQTLASLDEARALASAGRIPPPLVDSPKCPRCSLVSICLPDETWAALGVGAQDVQPQAGLFDALAGDEPPLVVDTPDDEIRRLVPPATTSGRCTSPATACRWGSWASAWPSRRRAN